MLAMALQDPAHPLSNEARTAKKLNYQLKLAYIYKKPELHEYYQELYNRIYYTLEGVALTHAGIVHGGVSSRLEHATIGIEKTIEDICNFFPIAGATAHIVTDATTLAFKVAHKIRMQRLLALCPLHDDMKHLVRQLATTLTIGLEERILNSRESDFHGIIEWLRNKKNLALYHAIDTPYKKLAHVHANILLAKGMANELTQEALMADTIINVFDPRIAPDTLRTKTQWITHKLVIATDRTVTGEAVDDETVDLLARDVELCLERASEFILKLQSVRSSLILYKSITYAFDETREFIPILARLREITDPLHRRNERLDRNSGQLITCIRQLQEIVDEISPRIVFNRRTFTFQMALNVIKIIANETIGEGHPYARNPRVDCRKISIARELQDGGATRPDSVTGSDVLLFFSHHTLPEPSSGTRIDQIETVAARLI